jgi:hypothetical protein
MPHDQSYRDKTIKITDLVDVTNVVLDGFEFTNCDILGPAILFLSGNGRMSHIGIIGLESEDIEALLWEVPTSRKTLVGCIAVKNSTFDNCRFTGIGFAGPQRVLDAVRNAVRR